MAALVYPAERPGQLVTREDLEDAEWEAGQIITMNPEFSLQQVINLFPFKDPADREHFLSGLRQAGLIQAD